jgi:hypothetical protein
VVCSYSKRIGDAPAAPTAETHGPVVESSGANSVAEKSAKKSGKKALQTA